FPDELVTYTDVLTDHGYYVGLTGKGWGPGRLEHSSRTYNPAGKSYDSIRYREVQAGVSKINYAENFKWFLAGKPSDQPFCFWMGTHEPHRPYEEGSGLRSGKNADQIEVPGFLPDTPEMRSDLADYYLKIEWFDKQLGRALFILDSLELLDNTLIVVTSDDGMPFPRAKSNIYDFGSRMPLAIMWPGKIKPDRTVSDFISLINLAPTFLEAAGINIPEIMSGKSMMPLLVSEKSGMIDPARNFVFMGKERHAWCQPGGMIYPSRAIRSEDWLFIRNFRPDLWPAGHPDPRYNYNLEPFGDVDPAISKNVTMLLENTNEHNYFDLAYGKRPAYELYDVHTDPLQLNNIAGSNEYKSIVDSLNDVLTGYLHKTEDPRVTGRDSIFEKAPYYFSQGIETGGINWLIWKDKTPEEQKKILDEAYKTVRNSKYFGRK
ncbi:MAG TPA: sulfatase, partial [Cyclobacteriaceae bacterium]|nr:sulfatase [Cyclobacteriaceae bacterium]